MFRNALAAAVLILAVPAFSLASDWDGLWWIVDAPVMVREHDGSLLVVSLDVEDWSRPYAYEVFYGPVSGTQARLNTLIGKRTYDMTVTLTSASTGILRINQCSDGISRCEPGTIGVDIPLVKIF